MRSSENGEKWGTPPKSEGLFVVEGHVSGNHTVAPLTPSWTEKPEEDPWSLPEIAHTGTPWKDLTTPEKAKRVILNVCRIIGLLILLYLFVCSLSFLSNAFKLLGGRNAGAIFQQNDVLSNPVAGLMIGVLSTVMVQSSSTSTSIVVTMVAAELLRVNQAVYIIMGANVGTSVTNTIVALFHSSDRDQFRRAFAAATVHDMFNWLCVFCLLPLEYILQITLGKGYLVWLSGLMIGEKGTITARENDPQFLEHITKPFTNLIIKVDKALIKNIAVTNASELWRFENQTLTKHWCKHDGHIIQWCKFLLNIDTSDSVIGIILLVCSLVILCVCLILIVKILRSLLQGSVAIVLRKTVNSHFPYPFSFLTGYLAIIVGAIMTFLVQSSSIFTSTLTPLVAIGVLTLERTFPLTLGANIGTTGTALLAALANSDHLHDALHIALCHLLFNISGILIWYPIPKMRQVPIGLAKSLGTVTARYRWVAIVYILAMFIIFPGLVFALSLAGWIAVLIVIGGIIITCTLIAVINILQDKVPGILPKALQDWSFLPESLRSLEPYDRIFISLFDNCLKPLCLKLHLYKKCFGSGLSDNKSMEANGNDVQITRV